MMNFNPFCCFALYCLFLTMQPRTTMAYDTFPLTYKTPYPYTYTTKKQVLINRQAGERRWFAGDLEDVGIARLGRTT
jgi:hypothetical protein